METIGATLNPAHVEALQGLSMRTLARLCKTLLCRRVKLPTFTIRKSAEPGTLAKEARAQSLQANNAPVNAAHISNRNFSGTLLELDADTARPKHGWQ